jgi:hypothetical protein
MKTFLERIKLVDHLTTEVPLERREFVEKLKANVDPGDTGTLFVFPEIFSKSKNEYKGSVTYDDFKIRRKKKIFEFNSMLAVATGQLRQTDKGVIVDAEINGFHSVYILFAALAAMVYVGFIVMLITQRVGWYLLPLIVLHAAFMLGIPYMMIRRGVSRMKYDLERDLFYLTRRSR